MLAIAAILDGAPRAEAARIGGMDRQTLRDWVIRFNEQGPEGLINMVSPGSPPKLDEEHRAFLARMVEEGPIPAVHGVGDLVELATKRLKKGNKMRLSGLGILQVRKRAARMGRNPATGESIKIKASKKIAFRPAKELKEAM